MELQIFNNEAFSQVRTIFEDSIALFCASDVAKSLGYKSPKDAISVHCRGAVKRRIGVKIGVKADGTHAMQNIEMLVIPEGDVYRLIGRSKLPAAEKFERWVFDEVLPTIRKTGGYTSNEDMFVESYFADADPALKVFLVTALKDKKRYKKQLEEQKPQIEFAETV